MRVLVLLLVCILGSAYAMPPRFYALRSDQLDDDDDVDMEDEPFESLDDIFTFPSGGPGGPPSNKYLSNMPTYRGLAAADVDEDGETYQLTIDPSDPYYRYDLELNAENEPSSTELELARAYKIVRKKKPVVIEVQEIKNEEDEDEEDEDEDESVEDDGEQEDDSKPDYAVPDLNQLFPNPENRPRGPNDYQSYVKHTRERQRPQQQRPLRGNSGPPPPRRGGSSPPPPGRGRAPPPPPPPRESSPPPPSYRYSFPASAEDSSEVYNTIIIEAEDVDEDLGSKYRAIASSPVVIEDVNADEEEDDDYEVDDDEESDDDVDFSVPSYDTLFPSPGTKPPGGLYGGMRNSWNNPPQPPSSRSSNYARVLRLFQSPMFHDSYNPDYIINPQIAFERRNERMKNRYRDPNWRYMDTRTPYNYKPLLYQKGHWGNPREHDYNPVSGNHYIGGIYNGKTYY